MDINLNFEWTPRSEFMEDWVCRCNGVLIGAVIRGGVNLNNSKCRYAIRCALPGGVIVEYIGGGINKAKKRCEQKVRDWFENFLNYKVKS